MTSSTSIDPPMPVAAIRRPRWYAVVLFCGAAVLISYIDRTALVRGQREEQALAVARTARRSGNVRAGRRYQ